MDPDPTPPPATSRPMINGRFPKPPFWVTSAILFFLFAITLLQVTLLRSRFAHSPEPRVHFIQDMDNQVKVKTQHASEVFDDGRASRLPVVGTVSRQNYYDDPILTTGFTQTFDGRAFKTTFAEDFPFPVTGDTLKLGQKKFNTYCFPCHGYDGSGHGPIDYDAQKLQSEGKTGMTWVTPSNLTDAERMKRPNGHIFNTITNGIRNMGGYGWAMPDPHERWAIVAYVRALQTTAAAARTNTPATQPVAMK